MKKDTQNQEIHAQRETDKNELIQKVSVQEVSLEDLAQIIGGSVTASMVITP
jgi:hypothetical protein